MSITGRRINSAGEALIMEFEGLALSAYRCPAGRWTIGYGHTATTVEGMQIDATQAAALLRLDLEVAEEKVAALVNVPLNDNQFAALVSFTFNVGVGQFSRSTLLRKLNLRDYASVPDELLRWVNVKGELSRGLLRRRIAEGHLFRRKEKEKGDIP